MEPIPSRGTVAIATLHIFGLGTHISLPLLLPKTHSNVSFVFLLTLYTLHMHRLIIAGGFLFIFMLIIMGAYIATRKSSSGGKATVAHFDTAYNDFDLASRAYLDSVYTQESLNNVDFKKFADQYTEILNSVQTPIPEDKRLQLAKEAIAANDILIYRLEASNARYGQANFLLGELRSVAEKLDEGKISSARLVVQAAEAELASQKEYASYLLLKKQFIKESLGQIVNDNGGIAAFNAFITQNEMKFKELEVNYQRASKAYPDAATAKYNAYINFSNSTNVPGN